MYNFASSVIIAHSIPLGFLGLTLSIYVSKPSIFFSFIYICLLIPIPFI